MLPAAIAVDTITRLRGVTYWDPHGNQSVEWSNAATLDIPGCSVQPAQGDEVLLGRDSVTSRWVLFAPPDADLLSSDRVRHAGVDYEVDGSVQRWPDIGGLGHLQALLVRVEG